MGGGREKVVEPRGGHTAQWVEGEEHNAGDEGENETIDEELGPSSSRR